MEARPQVDSAGYWITPDGVAHQFPFHAHAEYAARLLKLSFDEKRAISFYTKAYEAGFVRVARFKSSLSIQLLLPATESQIETVCGFFDQHDNCHIVFDSKEAEIHSQFELRAALSGHPPRRRDCS